MNIGDTLIWMRKYREERPDGNFVLTVVGAKFRVDDWLPQCRETFEISRVGEKHYVCRIVSREEMIYAAFDPSELHFEEMQKKLASLLETL